MDELYLWTLCNVWHVCWIMYDLVCMLVESRSFVVLDRLPGLYGLKYDSAIACGLPLYLGSYKLVGSTTPCNPWAYVQVLVLEIRILKRIYSRIIVSVIIIVLSACTETSKTVWLLAGYHCTCALINWSVLRQLALEQDSTLIATCVFKTKVFVFQNQFLATNSYINRYLKPRVEI